MPKAILITKDNQRKLEGQYAMEEDELDGCEGYWLVADFGSTAVLGLLSQEVFEEKFHINEGVKMLNDYVQVIRNGPSAND